MLKLIIIRGNSGSGKSSLALELRTHMVQNGLKTALVEQDYLRRIVLKEKEVTNGDNIDLIEQTVTFALNKNYSVILEGILAFSRYGSMLERLWRQVNSSLVYYIDVPFEETVRRHATKPNAHEFDENDMRKWWQENDLTYFPGEKIIPAESSIEQSVQRILKDLG